MARLSLRALALLAAGIPAMTWSSTLNMEGLSENRKYEIQTEQQHRDGEDGALWRTGSHRFLRADAKKGRRKTRELYADPDPTVEWIMEGRSKQSGVDKQSQEIPDRDYLNGLVEASVATTDHQEGNIAFANTYQTGSTSMAGILYRYAVRHNLKLARVGQESAVDLKWFAAQVRQGQSERVDIMHYHISSKGHLKGLWSGARENYRGIMRDPASVNLLTMMREPREHFISYYYYFVEPMTKLSLEDFLINSYGEDDFILLNNPLASELGVTTFHNMEQLFVDDFSSFKLILLTDRFDEGLMVLRRLLGWSMVDMTYMAMDETKAGGIPVVDRPSFHDLPEKVRKKIDSLTELDQMVYSAAQVLYDKRLRPLSDVIGADVEEFQKLQEVVSDYLDANQSSKANAMYRAEDVYSGAPPMNQF